MRALVPSYGHVAWASVLRSFHPGHSNQWGGMPHNVVIHIATIATDMARIAENTLSSGPPGGSTSALFGALQHKRFGLILGYDVSYMW